MNAHHIIEQRLVQYWGINTNEMLCVAVTTTEHQAFTNAWRKLIEYGSDYTDLTVGDIWEYAQQVYKDYPELLEAAYKTLYG